MQRSTLMLSVSPLTPDAATMARAGEMLRRGGLVAFPTETVYGLGANALDEQAVRSIFAAKGRPANNPVIVHVARHEEAMRLVSAWPADAERLAERFWPGPLSLVLPKQNIVPLVVTAGGDTVAIRVPAHPVALALIEAAGVPIAAPSANRSMAVSPTRAEHVLKGLDGRIDAILDAGPTSGGLESTVVDLSRQPARLLRPGLVSAEEIEAVIGPIERLQQSPVASDVILASPGMMERHYAPQATLELAAGDGRERVLELHHSAVRVGWLALGEPAAVPPEIHCIVLPRAPAGYSAGLYAALHRLDELGVERIIVACPPETAEWLAVRDRLRRAAAG